MKLLASFSGGRYQSLIMSIIIFLGLIVLLLAFTFFTSNLLARNTVLMNETNRVANSAQSVIKDLFDLENSWGEDVTSPHMQTVLKRLADNSIIINSRLQALEHGGVVTDELGQDVKIPATSADGLKQAQQQWILLEPKIQAYLQNATNLEIDSADTLTQAVNQAKTSSLLIDESLSILVANTAQKANNQATTIRVIQILGVIGVLAYFTIFITVFVRRLQMTDKYLDEARQQTTEILDTVTEGLFLIDKNLVISDQYSRSLEHIINQKNLKGKTLLDLLKGTVSDKDLENAKLFVDQLYNPWVVEELIQDLNPLRKVKVNYTSNEHGIISKYLDFNFLRVTKENSEDIDKIFVSVVDITESVHLQETLEKAHLQHNQELEMISTILSVDQQHLLAFIEHTEQRINRMNDVLKVKSNTNFAHLQEKAQQLYREIHSLKGEASALQLYAFVNSAEKKENQLKALLNSPKLSGNDFLPFTVSLNELLELNRFIKNLLERLHHVSHQFSKNTTENIETNKHQWQAFFNQYARDIANRNHKKVQILCDGFDGIANHQDFNAYKDIAIQLLKNAIVHGIETPHQRVHLGKSEIGQIKLSVKPDVNGDICLSIADDGKGIDVERIRQKAIELGYVTAEQASQLSTRSLYEFMFKSGFSTSEATTEDAGRGVGMDIVQQLAISKQGLLKIESRPNQFTQIHIYFKA